jgi:LCP family protein required for cell wall assembly
VATLSGTSGQDDGPQTPHARYFRLPRKRRRWPWVLGYTIWALLGLVVAVAWGVDRAAQHLLDQISPNIPTVTDARKALDKPTGPDTTFIILGSDNRSWVPGSENLSDSIILVHLDPPQNLISIMSVPRDLAVTIPGYAGTQKINAAFSLGGPQLSIRTVRQALGVPINHYVDVGFEGFFTIVQHLGGLYTQVDRRYYNVAGDGYSPIDLYPGYQRLNGNQALAFARFRHTDTDIVRAARQQQIIIDLKRQASEKLGISDVPLLLNAVAGSIQTDVHSVSTLASIGEFLLQVPHGRIFHTTLQVGFVTIQGGSYDVASPQQIASSVHEFLDPLGTQTVKALPKSITVPHTTHVVTKTSSKAAKAAAAKALTAANKLPAGLVLDSAPAAALKSLGGGLGLPLLVPSLRDVNSQLDSTMPVRAYKIAGGPGAGWPSVVEVFANANQAGSYYDVQETRMTAPPVMQAPTSTLTSGHRTYDLFQDGSVLRYVGFFQNHTWYWTSNSFDGALTNAEMVGIAASLQPATQAVHVPVGVGTLTQRVG